LPQPFFPSASISANQRFKFGPANFPSHFFTTSAFIASRSSGFFKRHLFQVSHSERAYLFAPIFGLASVCPAAIEKPNRQIEKM
jgi:hypothetical protein